jgi:hypothetical protein
MHLLHDSRNITTYARSHKQLDYALATLCTAQAIRFGGYEPFNHRFASDHGAFFLDFDKASLFGSESPSLLPLVHKRDIHSRNPKEVTKYLEAKYNLMAQHNIFAQVKQLCDDPNPNHDLAKSIHRACVKSCVLF